MPTLRFVSAGAAQGLVGTLAREAGVEVEGSFGAVGAMLEKYRAGEPCDVVILSHAQITGLAAEGAVDPHACADLGSVPTSIAARAADAAPEVGHEAALRAALLAADAIYFPDPTKSTAGIHFAKVLDRLGIADAVRARQRTFPNGATAMRALAGAQGRPIGCTQSTEILATPGVKLVAPLPPGLDLDTVYTAAANLRGARAGAAAFVERLTATASRHARAAAGFRGYAIRPAVATDVPAVRDLVNGILAEYGLAPDPSGIDRDLDDPIASYVRRGGTFDTVADGDGKLVGCCGIYPVDADACELRKMYLAPAARGHGVGKRLLDRALAFARGLGFRRVELETASVLERAIAMYTGAGFRPSGRHPLVRRCDQAFTLELR